MSIKKKIESLEKMLATNIKNNGYWLFESEHTEPQGICGDERWVKLSDSYNYDNRAKSCGDDECLEAVLAKCEAVYPDVKPIWLYPSAQTDFDYHERCCHCDAVVNGHLTDSFFEELYESYFKELTGLPSDDDIEIYLDSYHFTGLSKRKQNKILSFILEEKNKVKL